VLQRRRKSLYNFYMDGERGLNAKFKANFRTEPSEPSGLVGIPPENIDPYDTMGIMHRDTPIYVLEPRSGVSSEPAK
jgi:hypothetical protein